LFLPNLLELPEEIPPSFVAALALGLHENSRVKRKLSKQELSLDEMLLAFIADRLNILIWQNTRDGHKGRNQPKSLLQELTEDKQKDELYVFDTPEDFDEWYEKTRT
jgi:hypothetical protein